MSQYKQKTGTDYQGSPYFLQHSSKSRTKAAAKTPKRQHSNSKPVKKLMALKNGVVQKDTQNGAFVEEDLLSKEVEIAKMNLKTLQKVDSGIGKILATVPHVVLYHYRGTEDVWERTSYEGTLFIYAREPSTDGKGFMILNRLNSENTQEEIPPGMEFREQTPFLLYRKEANVIFGLCIQDKELFTQTGKLLNSLGRETSSSLLCSADNYSAPSSQNSESSAEMDLQEVSNHGCLWDQCFSDDMEGSPEVADIPPPCFSGEGDFLPKFTDHSTSVFSSSYNLTPNIKICASGLHSETGITMSNGTGIGVEEVVPRASSPKEIPSSRGRSSYSNHCLSSQVGPPQVGARSHGSQKKRTKSPKLNQKPGPVKQGTPGRRSSSPHFKCSPLQHATSFDQMRGSGGLVEVKMDSNGDECSKSLHEVSPHLAEMRKCMSQGSGYGVSGGGCGDKSGVTDTDNVIVRKLFPSHSHPYQPPSSSSSAMSPAVQTLFSCTPAVNSSFSANFPMSAVGSPHGSLLSQHSESSAQLRPTLLSALSLDEIEKQMTTEAHDLHSYLSSNSLLQASSTIDLKEAESQVSSPRVTPSLLAEDKMVLLQPSAFTLPSPAMSFSSSSSTTVNSSTVMPLLLPSVAASSAHIKIKPPSPAIIGNTFFSNSLSLSSKPTTNFPAIPPLIHSAGMTAPPLISKPATQKLTTHHWEKEKQKEKQFSPKNAVSTDVRQVRVVERTRTSPLPDTTLSDNSEAPADFSAPRRSATIPHATTLMSPQQFLDSRGEWGAGEIGGTKKCHEKSREPLTRQQLQHALIYLIQNDEEFMDKVYLAHESLSHSHPVISHRNSTVDNKKSHSTIASH